MSNSAASVNGNQIDASTDVEPRNIGSMPIAPQVLAFHQKSLNENKTSIDRMGAEITIRVKKMKEINNLMVQVNNLEDNVDLTQNQDLLTRLEAIKDAGDIVIKNKKKLSQLDRDNVLRSLQLAGDNLDKDNKNQQQQMDIIMKDQDKILFLLKEVLRSEHQSISGSARKISQG